MMTDKTDTIRRAQQGDANAFSTLVSNYQKKVFGTVYRMTGRSQDVEDVGQDVFLRLYQSLGQLREVGFFDTWLYRLTVNTVYDHLRRKRRATDVPMADLSEEQLLSADFSESARRQSIASRQDDARNKLEVLLGEISDDDRALLERKEIHGLTLKELKKVYDANENAIKVRLFRARRRAFQAHERLAAEGVM